MTLNKNGIFSTTLGGKGENAGNQHLAFSNFPQCIVPHQKTKVLFYIDFRYITCGCF